MPNIISKLWHSNHPPPSSRIRSTHRLCFYLYTVLYKVSLHIRTATTRTQHHQRHHRFVSYATGAPRMKIYTHNTQSRIAPQACAVWWWPRACSTLHQPSERLHSLLLATNARARAVKRMCACTHAQWNGLNTTDNDTGRPERRVLLQMFAARVAIQVVCDDYVHGDG